MRPKIILIVFMLLAFNSRVASSTTDTWLDNGDGTVTDLATSLIWQQGINSIDRTRIQAIIDCRNLSLAGHSDWRLPNIKELASIIDHRARAPAIKEKAFSMSVAELRFWSSTNFTGVAGMAWLVNFQSGRISTSTSANILSVRCVRN